MKIPNKISYNGISYRVKEVEKLDGERNWGRTSFKYNEIHLERELPIDKKEQTFIHEMLHVAFDNTGLEWENKKEERYVRAWADNIYGILKQNKLLK